MITKHTLSNGRERFAVRVKRYGRRQVIGRFNSPYAAIHVEVEAYRCYLKRVWIDGKERSTS